jgi:hypothetical protein
MLSRRGLNRPWLHFEAGAGWFTGKPLLPICYGNMSVASLPQPYSNFQALSLPDDEDFFVESVAKHLKLPKPGSQFISRFTKWAETQKPGHMPTFAETLAKSFSISAALASFQDE